ncbi:MAG: pantoate--beta-alanine ligase [Acidimicrobiia bacterium]
MIRIARIEALRRYLDEHRRAGGSVGLVPTMGAFHAGHRSLMRIARERSNLVVVSLFVNPLQFGPAEDLASYPRDPDGDAMIAEAEGVDALFAPDPEEMYPRPMLTTVTVAGLGQGLCEAVRPGHFAGVATVVTKLFAIVGPCRAFFGGKDAQQLAVVRRLASDLDLPVEVVSCPTVRHSDGLAMSSRNAYLGPAERQAATALFRGLESAVSSARAGERNPVRLREQTVGALADQPLVTPEYVQVLRAEDLSAFAPGEALDGEVLVAIAARVGPARLIDNLTLRFEGRSVHADLGVREEEVTCSAR